MSMTSPGAEIRDVFRRLQRATTQKRIPRQVIDLVNEKIYPHLPEDEKEELQSILQTMVGKPEYKKALRERIGEIKHNILGVEGDFPYPTELSSEAFIEAFDLDITKMIPGSRLGVIQSVYVGEPRQFARARRRRERCNGCNNMIENIEWSFWHQGWAHNDRRAKHLHVPCFLVWLREYCDTIIDQAHAAARLHDKVKKMLEDNELWTVTDVTRKARKDSGLIVQPAP